MANLDNSALPWQKRVDVMTTLGNKSYSKCTIPDLPLCRCYSPLFFVQ